ncbi:MAG: ComEC/Rec2 family competence protein, partial [Fimbriiglobus sp.]
SFLSVFVLVWGLSRWLTPTPLTPLEEVIEDARPLPEKVAREVGKVVAAAYVLSLALAGVNMPLLVSGTILASPIGVLIGPPLVLLPSVALVSGFLLIVFGPLGWAAAPFAWVTELALGAAGRVVHAADVLPGGAVYLPGPPMWWLVGFYALVAGVVLGNRWLRIRFSVGLLGWVVAGLMWPNGTKIPGELRVTFLAVGAGGCTVVETPDGRCLVYDAGTTIGPSAIRRVVAPFLWHRGVTRIDELFLSHADADHFNGVAELFKRFPVAQVTLTPSFAEKPTREVAAALLAFEAHRVPVRVAIAGDRFHAGDVILDVLHPPATGPPGIENERSLVLAVRYAGATILLTGDLEKAGTTRVLELPRENCDVLMAPHHGSRAALPSAIVAWANPRLVVASRGPERGNTVRP